MALLECHSSMIISILYLLRLNLKTKYYLFPYFLIPSLSCVRTFYEVFRSLIISDCLWLFKIISASLWLWKAGSPWCRRQPRWRSETGGGRTYRTAAEFLCSGHDRYSWLLWMMRAARYTHQLRPSRTASTWQAAPWCRGPPPPGSSCRPPAPPGWLPCTGRPPSGRPWCGRCGGRRSWSAPRTATLGSGWSWSAPAHPGSTARDWRGRRRNCRTDWCCRR